MEKNEEMKKYYNELRKKRDEEWKRLIKESNSVKKRIRELEKKVIKKIEEWEWYEDEECELVENYVEIGKMICELIGLEYKRIELRNMIWDMDSS